MEFLKLLQIDRSLVAPEAQQALLVADREWHEEGCPREVRTLSGILEKILQRCQASAIWYASVAAAA